MSPLIRCFLVRIAIVFVVEDGTGSKVWPGENGRFELSVFYNYYTASMPIPAQFDSRNFVIVRVYRFELLPSHTVDGCG